MDQDLTDSDLISLMNQLPARSLLLLEDIDTAGLSRKKSISNPKSRRRPRLPPGVVGPSTTKDEDEDEDTTDRSRVSLSGLLNAIDGVAAPEGHILIMTTNKPHDLDDALVRAGRISVRVGFRNASKAQAEQIFVRMYVDLPSTPDTSVADIKTKSMASIDLPNLAKDFASRVPDYEYSPADLQDYLLVHKKDPAAAVDGVQRWMDDLREERKKREDEKEGEKVARKEQAKEDRRALRAHMKDLMQGDETKDARNSQAEKKADDDEENAKEKNEDDVGGESRRDSSSDADYHMASASLMEEQEENDVGVGGAGGVAVQATKPDQEAATTNNNPITQQQD